MQLKIFFNLNKPLELPINYNHILQGIIYQSITKMDKNYAKDLHTSGIHNDNMFDANFKLFSFSKLIGKYTVVDKKIIFSNSIFWEIRSVDANFIFLLHQAFTKYGISFANEKMDFRMETQNKVITSENIHIRTLSPIVTQATLEDGSREYLTPQDTNFNKIINDNLMKKYHSYYNAYPKQNLEIIIENVSYKDKNVIYFKNNYITAWNGTFYLASSPEILTFLYDTGIGSKNSTGFGLFNIIDEDY